MNADYVCPSADCPMCSGEMCNKCGAGCWNSSVHDCDHDAIERHEGSPAGPPPQERET